MNAAQRRASWFFALAISAIAGGSILALRRLVLGNADPFQDGWPIYLNAGAGLAALVLSLTLRRPFVAAIGLYLGLLIYLFSAVLWAHTPPEYPVASCLALAAHGLLPALVGAAVGAAYLFVRSSRRSGTGASA